MKKINFKKMEIYTDTSRTTTRQTDGRKEYAALLYKSSNGIVAHRLAFKIYESEGPIEIDDHEEQIIRELAERACTPIIIDSIRKLLGDK